MAPRFTKRAAHSSDLLPPASRPSPGESGAKLPETPPDSSDIPRASSTSPVLEDPFAHIDPSLHDATLNSVEEAGDDRDRLNLFAQHVLQDNHVDEGQKNVSDAASLLAFSAGEDAGLFGAQPHQPFTELLGGANGEGSRDLGDENGAGLGESVRELAEGDDDEGGFEPEEQDGERGLEQPGNGPPPPPVERRGGRKRRRDGDDELPDGQDPARMKKDSHKEVERRRRAAIHEGITEIAKFIPNINPKTGKGDLLKKAAEYLSEVSKRVDVHDLELMRKETEKAELESQVRALREELDLKDNQIYNFNKTWQETESRAASSLFELEAAKSELADLKAKYEG